METKITLVFFCNMTFSSPPRLSAKIITFAAQWHHNFMLSRPKWTSVSSFICALRLGRCFRLIELKINLDSAADDWMETFPTFQIRKTGGLVAGRLYLISGVCWRPAVRCLFAARRGCLRANMCISDRCERHLFCHVASQETNLGRLEVQTEVLI